MTGRTIAVCLGCLLVFSPPVRAGVVGDEYSKLEKQFQDAERNAIEAYQKATTDSQKEKIQWPNKEYGPKFLTLAEKHPDDPESIQPIQWIVTRDRDPKNIARVLKLISEHHTKTKNVGDVRLDYVYGADTEPVLRKIIAENPNRDDQGKATLMLAKVLKGRIETAQWLKTALPGEIARYEKFAGKDAVAKMKKDDPAKLSAETDQLFQRVVDKFGDVKQNGSTSLGETAKGELFELHNLAIGKVAPDIKGTDVDGKKFALSEYRGKVVMIDFFGDW